MFLGKVVRKIFRIFTGEHPCRSVISIKLLYNFIEITLRHECSHVNLLHIFRTPLPKKASGGLQSVLLRVVLNPFHVASIFLYFLEASKTLWLFYVFRGNRTTVGMKRFQAPDFSLFSHFITLKI